MQMTEDRELIELLREGDARQLPSTTVGSTVVQNIPEPNSPTGSTEESLMDEVETNLRTIIDYGNNAVKDLADLASQSEHPRPYEALSTLIKSVTDANMSMLSIRKKERKVAADRFEKPEADEKANTVTASVADMLEEFEKRKKRAMSDDAIDADYETVNED